MNIFINITLFDTNIEYIEFYITIFYLVLMLVLHPQALKYLVILLDLGICNLLSKCL